MADEEDSQPWGGPNGVDDATTLTESTHVLPRPTTGNGEIQQVGDRWPGGPGESSAGATRLPGTHSGRWGGPTKPEKGTNAWSIWPMVADVTAYENGPENPEMRIKCANAGQFCVVLRRFQL